MYLSLVIEKSSKDDNDIYKQLHKLNTAGNISSLPSLTQLSAQFSVCIAPLYTVATSGRILKQSLSGNEESRVWIPLLHVQYVIFSRTSSKSKIKYMCYHANQNFLSLTLVCYQGGWRLEIPATRRDIKNFCR